MTWYTVTFLPWFFSMLDFVLDCTVTFLKSYYKTFPLLCFYYLTATFKSQHYEILWHATLIFLTLNTALFNDFFIYLKQPISWIFDIHNIVFQDMLSRRCEEKTTHCVFFLSFHWILFRVGKKKVRSLNCYCNVAHLLSHTFPKMLYTVITL